jgi:hypothetical protein
MGLGRLLAVLTVLSVTTIAQSRPSSRGSEDVPESAPSSRFSWTAQVIDRLTGTPIGGAEVSLSDGAAGNKTLVTDAKGRLHEPIGDAQDAVVTLPVALGGLKIASARSTWKHGERDHLTLEVDAYARLVVYAKSGDDLCRRASIDAWGIPPLPDLSGVDQGIASLLRAKIDSDPHTYKSMLRAYGFHAADTPYIKPKDAMGHSAELLMPYDGAVYIRVWAFIDGQAAVVVHTKRGESQTVTVQVPRYAVVGGVVLNADGSPARSIPVCVATRASFPTGDLTPSETTMLVFAKQNEDGKSTVHYRSMTDQDGRFEVPVMFTGEVCAYAFGPGGRVSMATMDAKSRGASVRGLEVRLPAAETVLRKMRFLRSDGTPFAKARISAEQREFQGPEGSHEAWRVRHPIETDADGWADVSGLKNLRDYSFELHDSHGGSELLAQTTVKDGAVVTQKEQ